MASRIDLLSEAIPQFTKVILRSDVVAVSVSACSHGEDEADSMLKGEKPVSRKISWILAENEQFLLAIFDQR